MYLKARLRRSGDLSGKSQRSYVCGSRMVTPELSESRVFRPICPPGAALTLDAVFNLQICGNREDFLSTDPLASPSAHNPAAFAHTALLTRLGMSQYTASSHRGDTCTRTHAQSRHTFPSPLKLCFTGRTCATRPPSV